MSISIYAAWSPTLFEAAAARRLNPCVYQIGWARDLAEQRTILNRPFHLADGRATRNLLGLKNWMVAVDVATGLSDATAAKALVSKLLGRLGPRARDWTGGRDPLGIVHGQQHGCDPRTLALADSLVAVHHAGLIGLLDSPATGEHRAAEQSFLRRLSLHARELRQPLAA